MKLIANPNPARLDWEPNESGLAARFFHDWEGQLLWSARSKNWLVWGKKKGVWIEDEWELAQEMCRASAISHQIAWPPAVGVPRFEKAGMLRNAMQLAKGRMSCGLDDFDTDPWLLNTPEGVIDLRVGESLPHRGGTETVYEAEAGGEVEIRIIPDYNLMVTEVAPTLHKNGSGKVVWKKGDTPTWEKHLKVLCHGDDELADYIQLVMGMSLIGSQSEREQVVVHWYGRGRNGKGVCNEVFSDLLGDYGMVTSSRALTMKDGDHSTDLHDFKGKRWVYTEEITKVNPTILKDMSGGGKKKAREIGKNNDTFQKSWVLNVLTNKPLQLEGDTSDGMWDRLKRIDFGDGIPRAERIADWTQWLRSEWPGILAWAVEGCLKYQKSGYWEPLSVSLDVSVAKDDDDALGQFLEERCIVAAWVPGARGISTRGSDFVSTYNEWRKTRYNQTVIPVPVVYADLRNRGTLVERGSGGSLYIRGVVFKEPQFGDLGG